MTRILIDDLTAAGVLATEQPRNILEDTPGTDDIAFVERIISGIRTGNSGRLPCS